jgi:hypothetical protein
MIKFKVLALDAIFKTIVLLMFKNCAYNIRNLNYLDELLDPTIDRKHFEPVTIFFSCPHLCTANCFTISIAP